MDDYAELLQIAKDKISQKEIEKKIEELVHPFEENYTEDEEDFSKEELKEIHLNVLKLLSEFLDKGKYEGNTQRYTLTEDDKTKLRHALHDFSLNEEEIYQACRDLGIIGINNINVFHDPKEHTLEIALTRLSGQAQKQFWSGKSNLPSYNNNKERYAANRLTQEVDKANKISSGW